MNAAILALFIRLYANVICVHLSQEMVAVAAIANEARGSQLKGSINGKLNILSDGGR